MIYQFQVYLRRRNGRHQATVTVDARDRVEARARFERIKRDVPALRAIIRHTREALEGERGVIVAPSMLANEKTLMRWPTSLYRNKTDNQMNDVAAHDRRPLEYLPVDVAIRRNLEGSAAR